MKHIFLLLVTIFSLQMHSHEMTEFDSYVSSDIIPQLHGLPLLRSCAGGTKIITEFEDNVPNELKGAFAYACEIWEEAMPTSLPIKIMVKMSNDGQTNAISTVSSKRVSNEGDSPFDIYSSASYTCQIKGTQYKIMMGEEYTNMYNDIFTNQLLTGTDIIITYYNKDSLLANCSFTLEDTVDNGKYDFVTIALRDIAKGFGLIWQSNMVRNEELRINTNRLTPYEYFVLKALGYDLYQYNTTINNHQAYLNAIKDSLIVNDKYNRWSIYAPKEWDIYKSLNYFIPQNEKKITQLLTYNFGKETLVRDIADKYTFALFRNLLYWKADLVTGANSSYKESTTLTQNSIPYKGTINLAPNSSKNNIKDEKLNEETITACQYYDYTSASDAPDLTPYHPNLQMDNSTNGYGWTIAILLKDGTWDVVYHFSSMTLTLPTITVDWNMLHFNHDLEDYARTCDAHLRCRITGCYKVMGFYAPRYEISYCVLDCPPQKAKACLTRAVATDNEEDYYRDVRIGINDIEGVTRVVVGQLDEGNDVPYYYELEDFRKGYFIATVDRELTTTFSITTYNDNGSATNTYILPPLTPVNSLKLQFSVNNNVVKIHSKGRNNDNTPYISSYQILNYLLENSQIVNKSSKNDIMSNTIDISGLNKGLYLLTVKDIKGGMHSIKFYKK